MLQLEWSESFATGVPEIDGEHRILFALVRAARQAAAAKSKERCLGWLTRLLDFSQGHFSREEEFLALHGYADVGDHRRYHDEIFSHAAALRTRADDLATQRGLQYFCDGLIAFLVDDVVRGDLQLKSFLQEKRLTVEV